MTLRNPSVSNSPRAGFTLLEIILVIGMIALLATIVSMMNLHSMLENSGAKPAFEIFREATHEGRIQSINEAEVLYLSFDEEAQKFQLTSASEAIEEVEEDSSQPVFNRYGYIEDEDEEEEDDAVDDEEPLRREFPVFEDELEVEFRGLRAPEAGGLSSSNAEYTSEPLKHLTFHPSGVSSPAVAILRYSNGEELVLTMDAFANGPKLSVTEGVGYY